MGTLVIKTEMLDGVCVVWCVCVHGGGGGIFVPYNNNKQFIEDWTNWSRLKDVIST